MDQMGLSLNFFSQAECQHHPSDLMNGRVSDVHYTPAFELADRRRLVAACVRNHTVEPRRATCMDVLASAMELQKYKI
jgi:hypothetical protein